VRLALDTNRYTDMARGDSSLRELLESAEFIGLPFVVLAELRAGFAAGTRWSENEQILRRFLGLPGVEVLWATEATIHHYVALYRQLRSQGVAIPTHDLWIAGLVLEHDLQLMSRDKHFERLPQIPVLA